MGKRLRFAVLNNAQEGEADAPTMLEWGDGAISWIYNGKTDVEQLEVDTSIGTVVAQVGDMVEQLDNGTFRVVPREAS